MTGQLIVRNGHRSRSVNLRLLGQIARHLIADLWPDEPFELGIHLVAASEITRLNAQFLQHQGPTDIITFDHTLAGGGEFLYGEMFICLDEAVVQARRFRVAWQTELVRYLVHGLLHLRGHEDRLPAARRRMKREENRRLRALSALFDFRQLSRVRRPVRARAGA